MDSFHKGIDENEKADEAARLTNVIKMSTQLTLFILRLIPNHKGINKTTVA